MIGELRSQLVVDLDAVTGAVFDTFQDGFVPPGLMVLPSRSGTYVSAGQMIGDYEISLDVIIVVNRGASPLVELASLDTVIELILDNTKGWALKGVDSPSLINISGQDYPATIVHLAKLSYIA